MAGLAVFAVPQAFADTVTLSPAADTFVQAGQPGVAYGSLPSFDVYGGTNNYPCPTVNGDPCTAGPAYGLLRFDLGSIPPGSTITGVQLKLGQSTGFAEDGDQGHHVIFLGDDTWDEGSTAWNNRPNDGIFPLTASTSLPPASLLGTALIDVQLPGQNLTTVYTFPSADTSVKSATQAQTDFTAAVQSEFGGDGMLSLEIFNPFNCGTGGGCVHANAGYWARYNSREASVMLQRPELIVTYAPASVTGSVFTVNTTDDHDPEACDTDDCTLREALEDAEPGDTVAFDIPGGGPHTISLDETLGSLPTFYGALLDGWSQGGASYTGPPLIEIDGADAGTGTDGLTVGTSQRGRPRPRDRWLRRVRRLRR